MKRKNNPADIGVKVIERSWNSYRAMVIPNGAGPEEIKETRQAFYSGAAVLFTTMTSQLFFDEGVEETPDDIAKVQAIADEVQAFGAEIDLAVLGIRRH